MRSSPDRAERQGKWVLREQDTECNRERLWVTAHAYDWSSALNRYIEGQPHSIPRNKDDRIRINLSSWKGGRGEGGGESLTTVGYRYYPVLYR